MDHKLDPQNEIRLIRQAQAGDAPAFGILYDSYIKKIYNFIYYKTFNKELAEDITSQAFLKAWKNIRQFKEGSFQAWLYSIARNAVTDHYRSCHETLNIDDCWDLSERPDWESLLDNNLKLESIKKAMSELKPAERELIMMRLWLDLSFKEIAEQLGKSEGAVKMSFGRTIVRLKSQVPLALIILFPALINIWKKTN